MRSFGSGNAQTVDLNSVRATPVDSPAVRVFDLGVCLLVLPLALVVGAITALLIYIDSPGSVFFRSTRVGRDGRTFQMLKFRKMRRAAEGGPLTVGEDERFTPIGRFLAMTKLDELPQLWNVIRGEMRLVGPRPEVPEFVARYPREYLEILSVLPGITGPAAVEYASESHLLSLQQDPTRYYEEQIMPRKLQIDLDYIRTRTLGDDARLLLRTALVPLSKVFKRSLSDPRAQRLEAGFFLGICAVLVSLFALASSSGAAVPGGLAPPSPALPHAHGASHKPRHPLRGHSRPPHRGHSRPTHARALKMIWGPLSMPDGSSAFPVYRRLGVQVLQLQLNWAHTAPAPPGEPANPADPAYRWPQELDAAVAQAAQYGIRLAIMAKGTPAWANGGREQSWAPDDPASYAAFLQAASRRYPTVHYWMIWGEVTRAGNFNPMPPNSPVGPERYAVLLDAAYGALKAASPSNMVIGGMTFTVGEDGAPDFIRWLRLPDGSPPRMDYYGHNPYSTRYPNLSEQPYEPQVRDINDIDTLHGELASAYRGHGATPKLWLSEFGISSDAPNRAFDFFVSRAVQARWVTAAFRLVDSVPYVAGLGWYDLLDEPPAAGSIDEGLMTAAATPKPAFAAYARAP